MTALPPKVEQLLARVRAPGPGLIRSASVVVDGYMTVILDRTSGDIVCLDRGNSVTVTGIVGDRYNMHAPTVVYALRELRKITRAEAEAFTEWWQDAVSARSFASDTAELARLAMKLGVNIPEIPLRKRATP